LIVVSANPRRAGGSAGDAAPGESQMGVDEAATLGLCRLRTVRRRASPDRCGPDLRDAVEVGPVNPVEPGGETPGPVARSEGPVVHCGGPVGAREGRDRVGMARSRSPRAAHIAWAPAPHTGAIPPYPVRELSLGRVRCNGATERRCQWPPCRLILAGVEPLGSVHRGCCLQASSHRRDRSRSGRRRPN
jgi:hypothetical protein